MCRSFSDKKQICDAATKGVAKIAAETFVKGTKVVKKNNFKDHLTKSSTHATAVLRLTDDLSRTETGKEASTSSSGAPWQATLTHLTARHKTLLTHKSQLARFKFQ